MGLTSHIFDIFQSFHVIPPQMASLSSKVSLASLLDPVTLAVIIASLYVLYQTLLSPMAKFPGPALCKVTGLWRSYHYWRGTWHDDVLMLHRTYGRAVRIAPNELSLVDENAMQQLYSHRNHAKKTTWYSTWDMRGTAAGLFSTQDNVEHSFLRKRVSGAYSMTSILKFEQYIQGCLDLFMIKMKRYAELGQPVNMSEWTNMLAFDVVGELAYGSSLGQLETGTDTMNIRKSVYQLFQWAANLGHFPGQINLINNEFMFFIARMLRLPNGLAHFQTWSSGKIRDRQKAENVEREDMLHHFMNMKDRNGNRVSHGEILIEALNIIGAGADTTSIGMRSTLYYICQNPKCYAILQQEIDDYYEANALTSPITYIETEKLPYLRAVVKEATRLLPSIVFQLLRYAPQQGLTVEGKFIPPGTPVGISPIAQNRDKDIWGPDADEFRPERWLEDEKKARRYEMALMTFGGNGPRTCIGRNIALVEIHKFIAQLLRNFDVELIGKKKAWRITSIWFAFQHDMDVSLKRRSVSLLGSD